MSSDASSPRADISNRGGGRGRLGGTLLEAGEEVLADGKLGGTSRDSGKLDRTSKNEGELG